MKTKLEIDTKTFVRFWLVIFAIVVAGYLFMMAQTAFVIIGMATFLALALNVPVNAFTRKFPKRSRVFAAAVAYLGILGLITAVLFLAIPPIVQQTAEFVQTVPDLVQGATNQWHVLNDFISKYNLQPQIDSAFQSMKDNAASWAGNVGSNLLSGLGSVFSFLTSLFLVIVLTFLMLVEGPKWKNKFFSAYTDSEKMHRHMAIAKKLQEVFSGYVTGQLTVSAIGSICAGLAVFIISSFFGDVPQSLAMAAIAITFLFSLVPLFGATIGGILIGLLLLFNSPVAALTYIIYFVIYQQIENNFISPHIQSKKLNLSALAVLLSITLGIYMFGILGALIAIPVAGCVRVLVDEYIANASNRRKHPKKA